MNRGASEAQRPSSPSAIPLPGRKGGHGFGRRWVKAVESTGWYEAFKFCMLNEMPERIFFIKVLLPFLAFSNYKI
jgi:hypothetical protein